MDKDAITEICKALAKEMIEKYDKAGDGHLSLEEAKPMITEFMAGMNDKLPKRFPACMILDRDFIEETYNTVDKDNSGQLS